MNHDVIITCALTGAGDTTAKSPHVPVTPKQIAAAAVEAAKAGATVVHCHVRDPQTGKLLWTRPTVEGHMGYKWVNGEKVENGISGTLNATWTGDLWKTGGAATWNGATYDPETNLIFAGTGNPAPWNSHLRPGDNLFSSSTVAIDADTGKIEEEFKRETALAVSLLRIVNSVGFGATRNVSTIRHAITLLGRRQLQRWLQLLLMSPTGKTPDSSRSPLLQVAALRGRMMELLIEHAHPRDRTLADQSFITGIMSMMPAALGLPMEEIFEQISLEPEVRQALAAHEGTLGQTLDLLECYDNEDSDGCERVLAQLGGFGIDHNRLNLCLAEALRWVNASEQEAAEE